MSANKRNNELRKILKAGLKLNKSRVEDGSDLPDALYEAYGWGEKKQPDGYEIALAEEHGGEGQGEEYWYVFSVKDLATSEVTYLKFEGFYSSYNGSEFDGDDFDIVESREVTVKQWFKV